MAKVIQLFGDVGGEVTEKSVSDQLPSSGDVTVEVNSRGGDYFVGLAIYHILRNHGGKVTIDIIGMAASAMALIAMAATSSKDRIMRDGSRLMIHRPMTGQSGNSEDFEKTKEKLESLERDIEIIHSENMGLSIEDIKGFMKEEKSFTSEEAEKMGFAVRKSAPQRNIKNYWKDLPESKIPRVYMDMGEEYNPDDVLHPNKFSTKPWKMNNHNKLIFFEDDGTINVNGLRVALIFVGDDEKKKERINELLNEFNERRAEIAPDYKDGQKIDLIFTVNGKEQVFPKTEKEIEMLQQIQEALGVNSAEEALEKAKEFETIMASGTTVINNGGITVSDGNVKETVETLVSENQELKEQNTKLGTKVEGLEGGIKVLTDDMKEQQEFRQNQEVVNRDKRFVTLKFSGHMSDKEVTRATQLWDLGEVGRKAYDIYVEGLEADEPKYKNLTNELGTSGDGDKNVDDPIKAFDNEVEKIKSEKKVDYTEAVALVEAAQPKLFEAYNEKVTQ